MDYTFRIQEALKEYNGVLYKMIEINIVLLDTKFENRALPINLSVKNGTDRINSVFIKVTPNQKELKCYFTIDAFSNFLTPSIIEFGYNNKMLGILSNIDLQAITALPSFLLSVPHEIANNYWLSSL